MMKLKIFNRDRHQLTGAGDTELSRLEPESSPSLLRNFFAKPKSVVTIILWLATPVAITFSSSGYFELRRNMTADRLSATEVVLSAVLIGVLITAAVVVLGGYLNRRKHRQSNHSRL